MSAAAIAGRPNLRLAATFRCGERRVVFAQITDRQTGEQTLANFFHGHLPFAIDEGIYNRRHYAGRTAGRRSDNQVATRVFLRRSECASGNHRDRAVTLIFFILRALPNSRRFGMQFNGAGQNIFLHRQARPHRRKLSETPRETVCLRPQHRENPGRMPDLAGETPPYPGLPIGVVS
jgi:hypothetical protein